MSEPDTITIRPFRPADQTAAKALILAGLQERWGCIDPTKNPDLEDIAASYAKGTFLLAWQGDGLVGTGALIPEMEGVGRIVRMSVVASKRRCGIGTAILERLCAYARDLGLCRLVLETTTTWHDAIDFYQRRGFRVVETRKGDTHLEKELG